MREGRSYLLDRESGTDTMQIMGIKVQDGEIVGRQVLYKGINGYCSGVEVGADDGELIVQTIGYLENGNSLAQVTVLEY